MKTRFRADLFRRSEAGTVAILWAMSLAVFFGLVALAYDIGRIGVTQSELKSFADSVALAAAGELDGKNDAITRATAAAANLISDTQRYGTGGNVLSGVSDYTLTFHSNIPADDTQPLGADITTDPREAAFAQVTVTPQPVPMVFAAVANTLLGNNVQTPSVTAEAVAGFTQEACDITPLMFCLPSSHSASTPFLASQHVGEMILLRSGGNGAAWGPGDFGFLDPTKADLGSTCAGLNGAPLYRCLVGAELAVSQCFSQRGVDIEPGQKVGLTDASFNVRFDIYKAGMNGKKNDPDYPPAPNVISGIVSSHGNACIGNNDAPSPDTMGLPRDACLVAGTCGRHGNGVWDYDAYIDRNHGNNNGVLDAGEDAHLTTYTIDGGKYAGTRYELYRREIEYGDSGALPNNDILTGRAETGRPQCSNNMSTNPYRRVLIAAGVDCTANPINGAATNVPVEEFFEMFITEPVSSNGSTPPQLDIMVEIIGSAGGTGAPTSGGGGIFRDIVQLYR